MPKLISAELNSLQQQFDLVKHQSIWALSISLSIGVSSVQVSFEHLGFEPENANEKRKAFMKAPPIVICPCLREYGNKLIGIKKSLQERFMISGSRRWWFVLDSRIEELTAAIEKELLPAAEELKGKILEQYDEARADYRARVLRAFAEQITDELRDEIIFQYLQKFPSPSAMASQFFVEIDGPLRISSILEDAEITKKVAVISLHKQWQKSILNSLQGSLRQAEDEIFLLVSELLEKMEDKPASALTVKGRQKFSEILERLYLLIDFNQSLENIDQNLKTTLVGFQLGEQMKKVADEYSTATDNCMEVKEQTLTHIRFKRRLDSLRNELRSALHVALDADGAGHRALAKWMRL